MTKFEEEVDKVAKQVGYESLSLLIGDCKEANKIYIHFKNWHSDEEFQELLSKYSALNDNYEKEVIRSSKLESQIIDLKSQLQQQALPVVPECVANIVEYSESVHVITKLYVDNEIVDEIKQVIDRLSDEAGFSRRANYLAWLKLNGYTVENPQQFYLKHIDMSKEHNDVDWYLVNDGELDHDFEYKGLSPKQDRYKFTQQEIDSMQTGSYEQIPVPAEVEK